MLKAHLMVPLASFPDYMFNPVETLSFIILFYFISILFYHYFVIQKKEPKQMSLCFYWWDEFHLSPGSESSSLE